jgi:hypothetical protein
MPASSARRVERRPSTFPPYPGHPRPHHARSGSSPKYVVKNSFPTPTTRRCSQNAPPSPRPKHRPSQRTAGRCVECGERSDLRRASRRLAAPGERRRQTWPAGVHSGGRTVLVTAGQGTCRALSGPRIVRLPGPERRSLPACGSGSATSCWPLLQVHDGLTLTERLPFRCMNRVSTGTPFLWPEGPVRG